MTHFHIPNRRYYILTTACAYLIFHYLFLGLNWTRNSFEFLTSPNFNFMNVALTLSLCVVYLTFIRYFSFYNLGTLKWISVSIIWGEILNQTHPNLVELPEVISTSLRIAIVVLEIILMILILRLDSTAYRAANFLKLFAKMWFLAIVLAVLFTILIGWTGFPPLFIPYSLFLLLPYFAILKFAGRLRGQEDTQTANT